jgi:4-amino-4-deoxy-L-arabinose transferase-like glycosyltransferase
MNSLSLRQFALTAAAIFLAVAALWLMDLGERKLANPDEGRYSVLAMHMHTSGDFVTPRLNGLKYFEKPPMQYWATATAFNVLGKTEWSARIYTALCGLLAILMVSYTAARLFNREIGIFTGLALVGCPYYMVLAEVVTLDMGLTFWTTLSVCGFLLSQRSEPTLPSKRERLGWLLIGWAAAAGAVLSKGLIGLVFPAAILFLYCLIQWDWRRLAAINWVSGFFIFFLVATPWFYLVAKQNPEFLHFFFIHEHFQRFTTTQHRRVEAWWFFIPILFVGCLAWAFMLVPALIRGWQAGHHHAKHDAAGNRHFKPLRFAIIWIVFIIFFFSISGSKLPAYILPTFPLIAMVLAYFIATTPGRKLAYFVAPIPVMALGLAWYLHSLPASRARNPFELGLYTDYAAILVAAFIIFAIGSAIGTLLFWRNSKVSRRWGVAIIASASVFMVSRIDAGYETLSPLQSGFALSQSIAKHLTPETRLYAVNTYDQTAPFYLGRYFTFVDYVDEFEMGQKREPTKHIPQLADFPPAWNQPGAVIAIIPPQDVDKMRGLGLDFTIIHESPRRMALLKR